MTLSTIRVEDMHCAGCAGKVQRALAGLQGVSATYVNAARRQVLVEHGDEADPASLLARIEAAGFHGSLNGSDSGGTAHRDLLKRLGVAGLAMMQVMMFALALYLGALEGMDDAFRRLLEYASLVFCIPVVGYAAVPFFRNALGAWRHGLNMDVPIAVAIALAFAVSVTHTLSGRGEVYYDSVVMFTFLLLGARYIDNRLKTRFEASNAALAALPAHARVVVDGGTERRPLESVAPGTRVWVAEGAQVPLDGDITEGEALLDESVLTGESVWVPRRVGEAVYAGTVNGGAGFEICTTARFDATRIAGIADLASRAEAGKPRAALLADRIARFFVPGVLLLAGATWLGWQLVDPARALVAALTVLVVSCPCALSLATPAAFTAAMTRLRQHGIVLTRSEALEQVADVDAALLDKTGTLTVHDPALAGMERLAPSELDDDALLDLAAALQRHSAHPLARAFPEPRDARVERVRAVTGAGVEGVHRGRVVRIGHGRFCGLPARHDEHAVFLAIDGTPVARFRVSDPMRPDAPAAVSALKQAGLEVVMVSGDAPGRCAELARRLGIDYSARQAPEAKLTLTRALQADGRRVLVVGDGINDIAALAAADVSAAVLESGHMVKSRADVLLLGRRLAALPELVTVGRRTRRIVRENLGWALGYNVTAIPLAALGFMPPWVAALGMAGSSIVVMLNASRLLRGGGRMTA